MVHTERIEVATSRKHDLVDITHEVSKAVADSGVKDGLAVVFTLHTTTGLFINEGEGGLLGDVEEVLGTLVPSKGSYLHNRVDSNAPSHIQSVLLGPSLCIPVDRGQLSLGTWQSVFFAERDGPRRRTVVVKVVGE